VDQPPSGAISTTGRGLALAQQQIRGLGLEVVELWGLISRWYSAGMPSISSLGLSAGRRQIARGAGCRGRRSDAVVRSALVAERSMFGDEAAEESDIEHRGPFRAKQALAAPPNVHAHDVMRTRLAASDAVVVDSSSVTLRDSFLSQPEACVLHRTRCYSEATLLLWDSAGDELAYT
jgi:hypothetical protein